MPDEKACYSETSTNYIENDVVVNTIDKERFERVKGREATFNKNWCKQKVNLNEIVKRFTPNANGKRKGYKYVFENQNYEIRCDMIGGYLRILDKHKKRFIELDGRISKKNDISHFKILRREEM